jgi:cytochrome c oxidase cbb3-type subunit 4
MTMDLNDLRTLITAISFIVFAGIVYWAYSSRQRGRFEEAANLPFIDAELPGERIGPDSSSTNGKGDRP